MAWKREEHTTLEVVVRLVCLALLLAAVAWTTIFGTQTFRWMLWRQLP